MESTPEYADPSPSTHQLAETLDPNLTVPVSQTFNAKKHNKRYRPPGPPFHDKLFSKNGRFLRVRLEVPEQGEECPLTLSPIAEDSLEFLQPSTTWYQAFPSVKKMVLPCNHSFGALSILYHFYRRNMLCPCCRSGLDSTLVIGCIPSHFRLGLSTHAHQEVRKDVEEHNAENARAAAMLQSEDGPVMYMSMEIMGNLSSGVQLNVEFFGRDSEAPSATTVIPLLPSWQTLRNLYNYEHGDSRRILDDIDELSRDIRESRRFIYNNNRRRDARTSRRSAVQSPEHPRSDEQDQEPGEITRESLRATLHSTGHNSFTLLDRQAQSHLEEQLRDRSVHEVAFTAFLERDGPLLSQSLQVGRTDRVPLQRSENRRLRNIDAGNGSRLFMETHMGDSEVIDLTWAVPDDFLYTTGIL